MVRVRTRREKLETQNKNSTSKCPFSFKDLISGFGIGLALAALYVNGKQRHLPLNNSNNGNTIVNTKAPIPSNPSGQSSITATTQAANDALQSQSTNTGGTSPGQLNTVSNSHETSQSKMISLIFNNEGQKDFFEIGSKFGTDKVLGPSRFKACAQNHASCEHPDAAKPQCKVLPGHFYHTMYHRWLGPYSTEETEPFQFLEIGFYNGKGFDTYSEFMPKAETHSIEISCIEQGPREEGKWPWGNFAEKNPKYQELLDKNNLHCGDANDINFIHKVWTTEMKSPNKKLKVVVDDAAHIAEHMATTLFYWFPRIEPGGILVIEDIQPIVEANKFRTDVLPQIMKDLHYCGDPIFKDRACFPSIWPLLQSIHCEMHICVFERNDQPAIELDFESSRQPPHTLNAKECLFQSHI